MLALWHASDWYKCGTLTCHKCDSLRRCGEFANKILIFAVLEQWFLQLSVTDSSFVCIIDTKI